MRLKITIVLLAIITILTFIARAAGTLYPKLLTNLLLLKILGFLSLLSFLAVIVFFVFFYIDFARKEGILLKIASILMIIGSSTILILFLKSLFFLYRVFPSLYMSTPGNLEAVLPWFNALFTLFFFIAFFKEMLSKMGLHLKCAVSLMIISAATVIVLKSLVLVNYFSSGGFEWFSDLFLKFPYIFMLISFFWFLTSLYFYFALYRELD